jgi:type IV secretion system protein VirB6
MAAGLASGLALSTFGLLSAAIAWGLGRTARGSGQLARGLFDRETARSDPLSRKAGYYLRRGALAPIRAVARRRENAVRPT